MLQLIVVVMIAFFVIFAIVDPFVTEESDLRELMDRAKDMLSGFTVVSAWGLLTFGVAEINGRIKTAKERERAREQQKRMVEARETAVEALFFGYKVNFLERLMNKIDEIALADGKEFDVYVIKPAMSAVRDYEHWRFLGKELERNGFEIAEMRGDELGVRTIFEVLRKGSDAADRENRNKRRIIIDFPTTLRSIWRAIEIHSEKPGGEKRSKKEEEEIFTDLRETFFKQIEEFNADRGLRKKVGVIDLSRENEGSSSKKMLEQLSLKNG